MHVFNRVQGESKLRRIRLQSMFCTYRGGGRWSMITDQALLLVINNKNIGIIETVACRNGSQTTAVCEPATHLYYAI